MQDTGEDEQKARKEHDAERAESPCKTGDEALHTEGDLGGGDKRSVPQGKGSRDHAEFDLGDACGIQIEKRIFRTDRAQAVYPADAKDARGDQCCAGRSEPHGKGEENPRRI